MHHAQVMKHDRQGGKCKQPLSIHDTVGLAVVNEPGITVVLTGGGSGGHITPVLAVAKELKNIQPSIKTVYIGQKGDSLTDIVANHSSVDEYVMVRAGKLRRYHTAGLAQIFDLKTLFFNVRDMFRTVIGLWSCFWLLRRLKPAVIFIKGGFVGVPVGLAAALLGIPYVTHDSDAIPGLANRIVAKWARMHAVALPKELYAYPQDKTVTVGVPISSDYVHVTASNMQESRSFLKISQDALVVLVAGGGLGAQRVNQAVRDLSTQLLHEYPKAVLLHQAGRANASEVSATYNTILTPGEHDRVRVMGFTTDMYHYSAAADVVIARAGGTNLAELAVQGKACIVVPNPYLTGGHQIKNAQALADSGAIVVVPETELQGGLLYDTLRKLLDDPHQRNALASKLHELAEPDAAKNLAKIILSVAAE